jgi:hypothetical protein
MGTEMSEEAAGHACGMDMPETEMQTSANGASEESLSSHKDENKKMYQSWNANRMASMPLKPACP